MGSTVGLEHKATSDDHVCSSDFRKGRLKDHGQSTLNDDHSEHRLLSRLGTSIKLCTQPAALTSDRSEDVSKVSLTNETEM